MSKLEAPDIAVGPTVGHGVTLGEATRVWARVAMLSFGGPAGQIAVKHRILVEEKKWIGETRFLHALNYCMLLPGPEAQQLATYIGWLLHGIRGGLIAGGLFVLPGYVALMILSWLYAGYGDIGAVQGLFFGLKAAVLAVVLEALVKIGKRALRNRVMVGLAGLAFVAIFFFGVPFPLIVIAAALVGFVGNAAGIAAFRPGANGKTAATDDGSAAIDRAFAREIPEHVRPATGRALRIAAICLVLWLGPLVVLLATVGTQNVFTDIAAFFATMAVVTFGGAYAVLAYVAQAAVEHYGWLQPGEMLAGLGMAETTPGPLIIVLQFVGFMGAFRHPGLLPPMLAGVLGGTLATWTTFAPCFLWIFVGGPYIEALRGNKALSAALSAITAAIVGVVLNLAVWFAIHTLFGRVDVAHPGFALRLQVPDPGSISIGTLILATAAMLALFRFKVGMIPTLAVCSALGVGSYFLGVMQ
ncbi:chromate transporter [Aliidongia dinghuensis]|uniref:Chromate transporter n=1 Tax=Aliidongia dinghuensis TaxID=1867774 RepID=A0A8J2YRR6_9PROT|nr:chromate efflux transporter [Aliidongia dinghuensis]GGF09740.1 chromate transporter [Aliidongia dinghuensis]